ncbi:hypothetical protein [Parabacteroides sp.]
MATPDKQYGLLRTTYDASFARLDNYPAMESDWCELLPRLAKASSYIRYRDDDGREGTLVSLWTDHVLTVLADIARQGTPADAATLQGDIDGWIARLDRYIDGSWKNGNAESPAVGIARQLKRSLEASLPDKQKTDKRGYYKMLRCVRSIRERFDYYLEQIENNGDMDGALSLLLTYLRNYGRIAQLFNRRLAALPLFYHRDILHAIPQGTIQDNVYIVVSPAENATGFTLPAGQPFPAGQNAAGDDLIYRTNRDEYISPMQCAGVNAVYLTRGEKKEVTGIRMQTLSFLEAGATEPLFADACSRPLQLGWQVESPMLVLDEGERNVSVRFCLTAGSVVPDDLSPDSFTLQFSSAEGWTEPMRNRQPDPDEPADAVARLYFDFTIAPEQPGPVACNEETHGLVTANPVVRILTAANTCPYDPATRLTFDAVEIRTKVTGIRNFSFYNELGAVDTSQPFQPFGLQAGKDAWFLFGNEEMGLKTLQEVSLTGDWKKLPDTKAEFNDIYKDYGCTADSFKLKTEWQQGGTWDDCDSEQSLFTFDQAGKFNPLEVLFRLTDNLIQIDGISTYYEYDRNRDGFFRATLTAPSIGFGADAYRSLFTETMLHNSRCKKKDIKTLPTEPPIPLLADAELSYIALEKIPAKKGEKNAISLSRITALPEPEAFYFGTEEESPFLPAAPSDHLLYFVFLGAQGEQTVRMYLDMVLPPSHKLPDKQPSATGVKLSWEYRSDNTWQTIPSESVRVEETRGLTQSGFIEIRLPEKVGNRQVDKQGRTWLRAALTGDVTACLAIRNIRINCLLLTAMNGDSLPLPAETIQSAIEPDERIESVAQPLCGFGGRPAETENGMAMHQIARVHNRHRAVTPQDYEQLVLEHFPKVDKVQCLTNPSKRTEVRLVIFSSAEDKRYYLSPAWKLVEIERIIRQFASPFVCLNVVNPLYKVITIKCKAVLWPDVKDEGKTLRQLIVLAQNYIEPWYRKGGIPTSGLRLSYKELHSRMANHEDLMKLVSLEVDGKSKDVVDINTEDIIICSSNPTDVLIPDITIELLSPRAGIEEAEIEGNFLIR